MARLGAGSHGVVTRGELLDAGLSLKEIEWRLRVGALRHVHRGVYRVGHDAPDLPASYLAAVRACGPGSLLAGTAGAHHFELLRGPAPRPDVITRTERRIAGVTTRRFRHIDRLARTAWNGVPVLAVPDLLVDLAASLPIDALARAAHEAGVRFRVTPRDVDRAIGRRPKPPGAAKLRAVMSGEARVTLSRLESRFLERLREIDRPLPETNRPAGGRRVDCRWPEQRLTVELDSYGFHNSRHAWENDHRREREAYARGDDFRRYTYGDVFEDPAGMHDELSCLLPPLGV